MSKSKQMTALTEERKQELIEACKEYITESENYYEDPGYEETDTTLDECIDHVIEIADDVYYTFTEVIGFTEDECEFFGIMDEATKDEKAWEIIDQYDNNEIGFSEAIELFAELNKNDISKTIADLEYMISGVLTKESTEQVIAVIEKRKGDK